MRAIKCLCIVIIIVSCKEKNNDHHDFFCNSSWVNTSDSSYKMRFDHKNQVFINDTLMADWFVIGDTIIFYDQNNEFDTTFFTVDFMDEDKFKLKSANWYNLGDSSVYLRTRWYVYWPPLVARLCKKSEFSRLAVAKWLLFVRPPMLVRMRQRP